MSDRLQGALSCSEVSEKEVLVRGEPASVNYLNIGNQTYLVSNGFLKTVSLEDDWYEDVRSPADTVDALNRATELGADLFTFWQRPPDVAPKYDFYHETEEIAVLPVSTYDHWWTKTIKSRVRTTIRKSLKQGIEVKEMPYDDEFVRGMTKIFNEAEVRQGRKFWHYGKDFETIKRQFSRFVHRERMIGAYYEGEMVGFVMLGDAGRFSLLGQILSSLHHRNRAPNNVLIAKAVEISIEQGHEQLVYWYWSDDSLSEFKRRCGFEKLLAPRYFVPLSNKGRVALKLGAHRGVVNLIPPAAKKRLKEFRTRWNRSRGSTK